MVHGTTHLFALWYPTLSQEISPKKTTVVINDPTLMTRMSSVLRLRVGERCILFDRAVHAECVVHEMSKKTITMQCEAFSKNTIYTPSITALLPLLKKDDLATALTQLVACGISAIQLVLTEGVQRAWGGDQEFDRLERVMIAAAEQSKCYAMPELFAPISLEQALARHKLIICGDPEGMPFKKVLEKLPASPTTCAILVGPEADLSEAEKMLIHKHGVVRCALTPTILRSHLAITILAGAVRSWYYTRE